MRIFLLLILVVALSSGCRRDPATEFVDSISCYYNFSTVDWVKLSDKYYRPNTADWDSQMQERIVNDFPLEIASEYWHLLRNARTDFHQKSLSLRMEMSKSVIEALDKAEAMFDTVFVRCVSQEYYMRLFSEMYNEVMPSAIDELIMGIKHY